MSSRNQSSILNKLFTILFFFLVSASAFGQKIDWIPFNWEGATLAGRRFDKVAITVPVTLDNLPHKFNMQLDLGAINTVIYGNSFAPYLEKYAAFKSKIDTTRTFYIQSRKNPMFTGVSLKLGDTDFGRREIGYFKNYGTKLTTETIADKSGVHIGTIAPDLFQGKILIIDYPHKRLCVVDKMPKEFAKASLQPFKLKDGRIKIPLRINNAQEYLLFDTGSSLFSLLTTKQRAEALATGAVKDSIKTSSWGENYYVYGRNTGKNIYFGKKRLGQALVFHDNLNKFDKFYEEENIWGITGNAYFLNNVVIIDYKNQLFGIQ